MQSIQKCGLEDCKVAKDIDIALLRSCRKDWWIEMKNVQISQELFFLLVRYFLIGQEETEPEIVKALEKKMDALVMRELYTQYKTAPTEEEKEKAQLPQAEKASALHFGCIGNARYIGKER